MKKFRTLFGDTKPVIAMIHLARCRERRSMTKPQASTAFYVLQRPILRLYKPLESTR